MAKTCTRCVMNDSIPGIEFDSNGVCTYCKIHDRIEKAYPLDGTQEKRMLKIVDEIKKAGKDKEYDCIMGVSGGCDSSYLLHLSKELGLRPLAVTFDNTWNSTTAVRNLHGILKKLDIDLFTYVVDNAEFNDMCRSVLKASVPDADIPNDIAIAKVYYMAMDKYDVDYSICGHSFRTEGTVPLGWTYMDGKYVESIQKKFGTMPLKTYPNLDLDYWLKHMTDKTKKRIRLLYYLNYRKSNAKKLLEENYGWKWYGAHHFENEFSKFVKGFLLPVKFKIDKRYVEFSALVRSGQKDKADALKELETLPELEKSFIKYVQKRLGLDDEEFDRIMNLPIKSHHDYETYHPYFRKNKEMFKKMLDKGLIPQTFYEKYTK